MSSSPAVSCAGRLVLSASLASLFMVLPERGSALQGTAVSDLPLPCQIVELAAGWRLRAIQQVPEEITALHTTAPGSKAHASMVYAGTSPRGGVYRFEGVHALTVVPMADCLGDDAKHGASPVNHLAIRDLDHDGIPELLAQTCQITPIGRPRVYVWSLTSPPVLRGFARPEISSSWSHALGFVATESGSSDRVFSTYCGYGEIVEFRLESQESADGFRNDTVSWRQVGRLPCSGEQAVIDDIDNDGRPELVLAAGFAIGQAAIRVFEVEGDNGKPVEKFAIDEGGRFGNVRYLIGDFGRTGRRQVIAWWCDDLAGGSVEMIRYELEPAGRIVRREVIASGKDLWPSDGQMTLADTEGRGRSTVWFASPNGQIWQYDPGSAEGIVRVAKLSGRIGPIAPGPEGWPGVLVGWDRYILRLDREGTTAVPPARWPSRRGESLSGSATPMPLSAS